MQQGNILSLHVYFKIVDAIKKKKSKKQGQKAMSFFLLNIFWYFYLYG